MKSFLNWRTSHKLFFGFVIMICLLITVEYLAISGIRNIKTTQETIFQQKFPVVRNVLEIQALMNAQRGRQLEYLLSTRADDRTTIRQNMKEDMKNIDD